MTPRGRALLDELQQEALDSSLPWGGRSPRFLTEAYQRFSLPQEAAPLERFFDEGVIDEQYQRFLTDEGG